MPSKRRGAKRPEMLSRIAELTSYTARISIRAEHRRGQEPEIDSGPWLELRGTLEEPVKSVHDVLFSLYPVDEPRLGPARPAGIGAIIGLKSQMSVVVKLVAPGFRPAVGHGLRRAARLRPPVLHEAPLRQGTRGERLVFK